MKRIWSLACVVLLTWGLVQSFAWAEQWQFLGMHPEGKMYLDMESVTPKRALIGFWARRVYTKPQASKISQMKFQEQIVWQELDCAKRTMNMAQMIFLDAQGKPVGAYVNLKGGPKPIESTGFFAKEAALLCKSKPENVQGPDPKTAVQKQKISSLKSR